MTKEEYKESIKALEDLFAGKDSKCRVTSVKAVFKTGNRLSPRKASRKAGKPVK